MSAGVIQPAPRGRNPFDASGVERDAQGIAHYRDLAPSLVHMLSASAERDPGKVAVVQVGGGELTYRELFERAARVAGGLRAEGLARGDRAAIRLPNGIDWVLAFWGTQLAGAVAVPVNTRFTDQEARYVIEDSQSRYVFEPGRALPEGAAVVDEGLTGEDLAAIFYTSGTTGFPKGAMTTHENFLTNSENAVRTLGTERAQAASIAALIQVPLFHVTGCNSQLIPLLDVGGRVEILTNPLDVEGFFTAVNEHGVDHIVSVPAIYYALIHHPRFAALKTEAIRWASYGGAPIAPELVREIQRAFPNARVGNGFGLTECSSLATFLPHEEAAEHADSVGFAMPVVDLAVAEPDEAGMGELLIRGANVVQGYWEKPEASAETFVEGWLHTGDVGRVDEEGLLYVLDRVKDMINRGGENVYSLEVENALVGAPGVGEVAVVGVPDAMMGEKVGAVLVPALGAQVDVDAVLAYSRERLADFKVPQYVAVRAEPLPRNPGGKVLKSRLRDETEWGKPLR